MSTAAQQDTKVRRMESASVRAFGVVVNAPADPTPTAPGFALTSLDVTTPTGVDASGTWVSWTAASQEAVATSPTIGATGADIEAGEGVYLLWVRAVLGGESPVWEPVGRVVIG